MTHKNIRRCAVPVYGAAGPVIGTATVLSDDFVLTALHVVDPEPTRLLRVGDDLPVTAMATLPLRRYGALRDLAIDSYERDRALIDSDLGTVDLTLLAVTGLSRRIPVSPRRTSVRDGERIRVLGCHNGPAQVSVGVVTMHNDANFVADATLQPGDSGAPAIDDAGRLAGLAVLDLGDQGTIFIGPTLIAMFVKRTMPLLTRLRHQRH